MRTVKLKDIASIYNGNSINKKIKQEKYMLDVPGYNYIATKDVNFDGTVTYRNGVVIPYNEPKFKTAPAGAVLVCSEGGNAGKKTAYITEEVCFGNKLYAFVNSKNQFIGKYLYYYTQTTDFFNQFKSLMNGIIGGVTIKNIGEIIIPLPSLVDQERIVARIEELFSNLDNAVKSLKETKQKLKIYRQAVLKEAFNGFENWDKYKFGNLMQIVRNGYGKKPSDSGKYKILKISAVRSLNLNLDECRYNDFKFEAQDTISENDLLFTRYNGSKEFVGVCVVVPKLTESYAYPDKLIKCTPKVNDIFHSKFLSYYLSQGNARKYLRSKIKTTSGQNGIAGSDIKNTIVHLPDLDVQERIVLNIETKLSAYESIENTLNLAFEQVSALRQSILKQALEGRLI